MLQSAGTIQKALGRPSSNCYPRGVSKATNDKYQGRASYLPSGATRKTQRSVGLFDSFAEAGLKVAEAEAAARPQAWV